MNVDPAPGVLCRATSPPCARTMSRVMASPRPVPDRRCCTGLVVALEEPRAIGLTDADPGVAHQDPARGAIGGGAEEDGAAVAVVGDRVGEQVVDDLPQPHRDRPTPARLRVPRRRSRIARSAARGSRASAAARTMSRASRCCGVIEASTDDDDELDAARMSATIRSRRSALRSATSRFDAHMVGDAGLLDREVEIAEDRGERRSQLVRYRCDQLIPRAQRLELGRDVSRDDDGAGVLPRRVGQPAGADVERPARAGIDRRTRRPRRRRPRRAAPARAAARRRAGGSPRRRGTPARRHRPSSARSACCRRPCASLVTDTCPSAAMRMTPKSTASSTSVTSCSCRRVRSSTRLSRCACLASRLRCASDRRELR